MIIKRLLYISGICFLLMLVSACFQYSSNVSGKYVRPLEIVKLSAHNYLHISYLEDGKGGYIPCNGFIRKEGNEVFIFDTPLNDSISRQLINYVHNDLKASIRGVMVSHSHVDGAGGVNAFAKANIPTYGSTKTAVLLAKKGIYLSNAFDTKDSISLGERTIKMDYLGPGHTDDNAIAYIEGADILLGGCLIKPLGGQRGNIKDANLKEWAKTVATANYLYPNVHLVIPGHGGRGGSELLRYTIKMFQIDDFSPAIGEEDIKSKK